MGNTLSHEPLVSIYIPTHNRSALLCRAVRSLFNQTYQNIEILICDDGSKDDTETIVNLLKLESAIPITYIKNDIALGACNARNKCIAIASGEYITGLDDDDSFTEDRVMKFIHHATVNNLDILSANHIFSDGNREKRGPAQSCIITFDKMKYMNYIGNQIFTKTKYLRDIGGFDESLPAWQDYDMWFRLLQKHGSSYRISDATYIVNIDYGGNRISTSSKAYTGHLLFLKKHEKYLSKNNIKSLKMMDLINRSQDIPLMFLMKNLSMRNVITYLKRKASKVNSNVTSN